MLKRTLIPTLALMAPIFAKPAASVADLVAKALAFKATLSASQQSTLQIEYSVEASRQWSNLPVTFVPRNGVRFADLSADQLAAAMRVVAAATGTAANQGYDEFVQITRADSILALSQPNGYGKGLYFMAFLNAPSTSGAWMLQFGGHHYAAHISFKDGAVIGATPAFRGVEPTSFAAAGGVTLTPLKQEKDAFADLIASLTADQKTAAKIGAVNDLVVGAGKDGAFPTTKSGIKLGTLTALQQEKAMAAIDLYVRDMDPATADAVHAAYLAELGDTYLAYAGTGAFTAVNDYVRLDGPGVWIEFFSPNGILFPGQVHYHTIWRDHARDYGSDLKGGPISAGLRAPKRKVGFTAGAAVDGELSLDLHAPIRNGSVIVSDLAGNRMQSRAGFSGSALTLDVSGLAKGAYLVRVEDAKTILRSRFTRL